MKVFLKRLCPIFFRAASEENYAYNFSAKLKTNGTRSAYLLPCSCAVGLPGAVHGVLVLPEVNKGGGQTGKVGDIVVQ